MYSIDSAKNRSHNSLLHFCLYLILFFLPLKRLTSLGWIGLPEEITLAKLLIAFTFFLWIILSIIKKDNELFSSPFKKFLHVAIILDLVTSVLSLVNATEIGAAVATFVRVSGVLILYLLLINIVRDKRSFHIAICVFFLGVSLNALAGVYELIFQQPVVSVENMIGEELPRDKSSLVSEMGGIRVQGLVGDADYNAHLCIITIGIVLGTLFGSWFSWPRLSRALLFFLLGILAINVFASSSRVGWAGFFICVTIFLLFMQLKNKWLLILGSSLLIVLLFVGLGVFSNTPILTRITGSSGGHSISLRIADAKLALAMFRSNPILGVGTGNFNVVKHRWYRFVPDYLEFEGTIGSMNGYLNILVEKGLIGLMGYSLIILSFITYLVRIMRKSKNREHKMMALGLLAAFFGHLTYLVSIPVQYSELMWLIIGFGLVLLYLGGNEMKTEIPSNWVGTIPYPPRRDGPLLLSEEVL